MNAKVEVKMSPELETKLLKGTLPLIQTLLDLVHDLEVRVKKLEGTAKPPLESKVVYSLPREPEQNQIVYLAVPGTNGPPSGPGIRWINNYVPVPSGRGYDVYWFLYHKNWWYAAIQMQGVEGPL